MDEIFRPVTWLEWPSTHQCTIQKILFWDFMDGMKLFPRGQFKWSAVFIFFWVLFFLVISFSQLTVFSPGPPFWFLFIFGHPWPHIIFWQLLPTPQIYLLPFLPPTYLPSSCCHASNILISVSLSASFYLIPSFSAHLHPQCLRNRDSLSIWV